MAALAPGGYIVLAKTGPKPQPPRRRVVKLQMPPEGRYTAHGLAALPPADRYHRRLDVPASVLIERDMAEMTDNRDYTGQFCGDPPFSRSALGQRKS